MVYNSYKTNSHSRFLLQFHLILVCKYRKKLLCSGNISSNIKKLSAEICKRHRVIIRYMEADKDHIHYMLETEPNINLSALVRTIKAFTTYHIREKYPQYLSGCIWKPPSHTICGLGVFSQGCFYSPNYGRPIRASTNSRFS